MDTYYDLLKAKCGILSNLKPLCVVFLEGYHWQNFVSQGDRSMIVCIYCDGSLAEQAFHCKHCGKQVRCKNPQCLIHLETHSHFCSDCGTAVGTGTATARGENHSSNLAINTVKFKDKDCLLQTNLIDNAVRT